MSHKVNSILFIILVSAIGFLNLIFHTDDAVSTLENKELQRFPEVTVEGVFKGHVTSQIDSYLSDQFMLRTPLIKLSGSVSGLSGIKSDITISVVANDNMITNLVDDSSVDEDIIRLDKLMDQHALQYIAEDSTSETYMEDIALNETYEVGDLDVNYIVLKDRAFASFEQNIPVEMEYADAINSIKRKFSKLEIDVLLTPTQVAFVDEKYETLSDNQVESLNRFKTLMGPQIRYINAYDKIKENYNDELFFRTDHHWNGLGAYYGYLSFCDSKGLTPLLRKDMVYSEIRGFLGSVYKMMNEPRLAKHPDTIMIYTPKINVMMDQYKVVNGVLEIAKGDIPYMASKELMGEKVSYSAFLGGDRAMTVLRNLDNPALPKLLVVKDSYGNALVPFLVGNYSEIYAVDPRHYMGDLTKLINEKDIKEVLFVNSANITRTSGYAEMIVKAFE